MTDVLRPARLASGLVPLLGFAILTAALDVYAGNQIQTLNPLAMTAISFTLAAVFFLGGDIARRGLAAALRPFREHRGNVLALNLTTAVSWIAMMYALKYIEPAVVNVVGLAVGPVITVLLGPLLRRGSSALRGELIVSLAICVLLGVLVWGSISGHSGVGERPAGELVLGIVLTLVVGIGSVGNLLFSKRLSDQGCSPRSVLGTRFVLMIVVSWALTLADGAPGLGAALLPSALIAVIGVGLPMYLLQVGVRHSEPITASLIATLSPLFALVLQLPDPRLRPSALSFACILAITACVIAGVVVRARFKPLAPGG